MINSRSHAIGEPLNILTTVDSTNKYAMQQVHAIWQNMVQPILQWNRPQERAEGKTWMPPPEKT